MLLNQSSLPEYPTQPETIELALCEQGDHQVPEELICKLDIHVCEHCLGAYYKDIVEAEDVEAISEYHAYVAKYPFLLNK